MLKANTAVKCSILSTKILKLQELLGYLYLQSGIRTQGGGLGPAGYHANFSRHLYNAVYLCHVVNTDVSSHFLDNASYQVAYQCFLNVLISLSFNISLDSKCVTTQRDSQEIMHLCIGCDTEDKASICGRQHATSRNMDNISVFDSQQDQSSQPKGLVEDTQACPKICYFKRNSEMCDL